VKGRHKLAAPLALTAATACVLALTMSAAPALAKPSASGGHPSPACAASQLSMTVPTAIAGDPTEGMGKLAWNILLRNTGNAGCSLSGWPRLSVTAAGRPVAVTSQDVSFSNLAPVRPQSIALAAGQQAVVTVQAGDSTNGCRARWELTLRLPGSAGSLTAAQPAAFFGPCGGGLLRLSPFYPRSALASAIKKLQVSQTPSVYPTSSARPPAACTAQRMRVAASYGSAAQGGSVQVLRLVSRGSDPCALAGEWPTITLRSADGTSQIAKALPILPDGVTRSSLVSYQQPDSVQTDLTLSSGTSASIALVTQTTGPGACHVATSAKIYPGLTDIGAGLTVSLSRPVTFCGLPRVLSFLAGRPSTGALMPAAQALSSGSMSPDGDSPAGFWYGSDSNAPVPTSSSGGVYLMPHSPTGGDYGGYVGELGAYDVWKGCTSGINWNQTGYNDAQSNYTNHSVGVGAGGYWMMAGPGREPGGFTSSGTNATNWGTSQAQRAVSDAMGQPLSFPYIFMDIEAADPHGWNKGFNGVCSGTVTASSISSTLDRDTFNGFWNYVENSSPYLAAVYEAGGCCGSSWNGIFGSSQTLGNTLEWTYVNETTSLSTFPTGWSVNGTVPVWYASAPSKCQMMWQWSGGNGQLNGVGDFDQIDGNRDFVCV
jgi:Domain of unknown function (DUF4232)